ncbi:phosphomevalonate kinase [Heyndrickxia acidiproducens]|uniref:phosphomevalonate kinase n=1 Tax=Heyndrickxia acidiproducens TaxID=1121084 RepID=UPI0003812231|nr:phosphomevalonate kinase [Heyndrickxia acidiproducens]
MSPIHYQVKAPGKLMIAGEYAVIEPGQPAVVAAVDRYITVDAKDSSENVLSLPQLGIEEVVWHTEGDSVQFSREDPRLRFIANALSVFTRLAREKSLSPRPLHLTITSELDDAASGKKYGLGSSAAILVSVLAALLHIHRRELPATKDMIYKLASIAHLKTQGNGSGADLAASTYGGWIHYKAFRPDWVFARLREVKKISELLEASWPYLSIPPLTPPPNLHLCVGWTGKAAATGPMVENIGLVREKQPEVYGLFLQESVAAVAQLVEGFNKLDAGQVMAGMAANRRALQHLGAYADVEIETAGLRKLSGIAEKYGAGKSSGAGGGDCGIAFVEEKDLIPRLYGEWETAGILPLELNVSEQGVTVRDM